MRYLSANSCKHQQTKPKSHLFKQFIGICAFSALFVSASALAITGSNYQSLSSNMAGNANTQTQTQVNTYYLYVSEAASGFHYRNGSNDSNNNAQYGTSTAGCGVGDIPVILNGVTMQPSTTDITNFACASQVGSTQCNDCACLGTGCNTTTLAAGSSFSLPDGTTVTIPSTFTGYNRYPITGKNSDPNVLAISNAYCLHVVPNQWSGVVSKKYHKYVLTSNNGLDVLIYADDVTNGPFVYVTDDNPNGNVTYTSGPFYNLPINPIYIPLPGGTSTMYTPSVADPGMYPTAYTTTAGWGRYGFGARGCIPLSNPSAYHTTGPSTW